MEYSVARKFIKSMTRRLRGMIFMEVNWKEPHLSINWLNVYRGLFDFVC
jgi:hypothetical protein